MFANILILVLTKQNTLSYSCYCHKLLWVGNTDGGSTLKNLIDRFMG